MKKNILIVVTTILGSINFVGYAADYQADVEAAFAKILRSDNSIVHVDDFPPSDAVKGMTMNSPNKSAFQKFFNGVELVAHTGFEGLEGESAIKNGALDASSMLPSDKRDMAKTYFADANLVDAQLKSLAAVTPANDDDKALIASLTKLGKKVQADAKRIGDILAQGGSTDTSFFQGIKNKAAALKNKVLGGSKSAVATSLDTAFAKTLSADNSIVHVNDFPTSDAIKAITVNSPNKKELNRIFGVFEFVAHTAFDGLDKAGGIKNGALDASDLGPQDKRNMARGYAGDADLIAKQLTALAAVKPANDDDKAIIAAFMKVGKKEQADASKISSILASGGSKDTSFFQSIKNKASSVHQKLFGKKSAVATSLDTAFAKTLSADNSIVDINDFPTSDAIKAITVNSPNKTELNRIFGAIEFVIHNAFSGLAKEGAIKNGAFDASDVAPSDKRDLAKAYAGDADLIGKQLTALAAVKPANDDDKAIISSFIKLGKKVQADASKISKVLASGGSSL